MVANTYFVLRDKSLVSVNLDPENPEKLRTLRFAIQRIGGPWYDGSKPPEAHLRMPQTNGRPPLEIYDVWVTGEVFG